ncbi:mitochondrial RNA binding protein 1 [Perkinsela sp. CCAP 1560/4]|nr:mitochondrial RNA binding protein 1 [Perkinsela sp. CCAP 1560/4]|eukprot:KNH04057.1 mitochondrial RNA binding protein 1 [Perkinsela sp. CCAP 1560/4]
MFYLTADTIIAFHRLLSYCDNAFCPLTTRMLKSIGRLTPNLTSCLYFPKLSKFSNYVENQPSFEIYDNGAGAAQSNPGVSVKNLKDCRTSTDEKVRSTSVEGGLVRIKYTGNGELILSHYPRLMREASDTSKRSIDITHRHSVKLSLEHIGGLVCVSECRLSKIDIDIQSNNSDDTRSPKYVTNVRYKRVQENPISSGGDSLNKCHRHSEGVSYVLSVSTAHQANRSRGKPSTDETTLSAPLRPSRFLHGFEIRFKGYYMIMWHRFLEEALLHGMGFVSQRFPA